RWRLDENNEKILHNKKIKGSNFLDMTKTKKELGEMLCKYKIDSNKITKIPPFEPESVKIDDEMRSWSSLTTGRNKAIHCEYISLILYVSIYITKRITKKGITMDFQFEVIGEEVSS
ncbi:9926_t:CDS:2, partial [Funneliformis caledonium]